MLLHLIGAFLFAYLLIRLVLPLRLSPTAKALMAAGLLLVSQVHLINKLLVPGWPAPELPPGILMLQGWLFISLTFLFTIVLFRDLARGLIRLVKKLRPQLRESKSVSLSRRHFLARGLVGIPSACAVKAVATGLILTPTAYGVTQAVATPEVHAMDLKLDTIPKALDGLTIAHLTDTHISPLLREDWTRALVDRVNDCRPDIILITGDIVDGLPDNRMDGVAPFRKLRARHGVFACPGNHEYYAGFAPWMNIFQELGMTMLCNAHSALSIRGAELVIAGLTDAVSSRFSLPAPSLATALEGSPEKAFRLLLDHRPGNAAHNSSWNIDLQLSGHTHGGHMPGMDNLVAMFNQGYVRGWYKVKGMPLYVNPGAGLWNGFPIRLGVPSEIARITLRSGEGTTRTSGIRPERQARPA